MSNDKENLIRQLAASYGLSDGRETRHSESRFDASTGTLYCEGITITKPVLQKAMDYYEHQKDYFRTLAERDSSARESYMNAVAAYNAIAMLFGEIKKDQ